MISSLSFHCTVVYIWGYYLLGVWNGLVIKFNIYPPVIWSSKVFFCLFTAIFEKKIMKTCDCFYYYYILIINGKFFFQTDYFAIYKPSESMVLRQLVKSQLAKWQNMKHLLSLFLVKTLVRQRWPIWKISNLSSIIN